MVTIGSYSLFSTQDKREGKTIIKLIEKIAEKRSSTFRCGWLVLGALFLTLSFSTSEAVTSTPSDHIFGSELTGVAPFK